MSLHDTIAQALNGACAENTSNTPDYILAQFLISCLASFDIAVNERERWYGRRNGSAAVPDAPAASGVVFREAALERQLPPGFRPA